MRCSCQRCGTYMVQREKGLESQCVCPDCFATCSACMGTEQLPQQREGLELVAFLRERYDNRSADDSIEFERFERDPYYD